MRATDNLSQRSSRLVNCILTSQAVGLGSSCRLVVAPADAVDRLGRRCRPRPLRTDLPDARIDPASLHALDGLGRAGDRFDAIFDQGVTVWEALTRIARVGRGVPFLQGGILRLVRDEARTLPVALFGPRNIVKGSLKVQYLMPGEDTADAVTVEYFSARIWAPDEVTSSHPDSASDQPSNEEQFGCTDEAQALREGLYMAAANRYRRRMVSFRTELEGLIPTYGDLIAIAHDMPRWGQGGEVVAWDPETGTLELSEPLEWADGETHYIALRRRDGTVSGPWPVGPGADDRHVVLAEDLDFTPYSGASKSGRTLPLVWASPGVCALGSSRSDRAGNRSRSRPWARTPASMRPIWPRSHRREEDRMNRPTIGDGHIVMPEAEFEQLLELAAERGALKALEDVGLDGDDAAVDIRDLRSLLGSLRLAKRTAVQTTVRLVTTGILLALMAGIAIKLKLFGNGP